MQKIKEVSPSTIIDSLTSNLLFLTIDRTYRHSSVIGDIDVEKGI